MLGHTAVINPADHRLIAGVVSCCKQTVMLGHTAVINPAYHRLTAGVVSCRKQTDGRNLLFIIIAHCKTGGWRQASFFTSVMFLYFTCMSVYPLFKLTA